MASNWTPITNLGNDSSTNLLNSWMVGQGGNLDTYLQSLGYNGPSAYQSLLMNGMGESGNPSAQNADPALAQWLQGQGYQIGGSGGTNNGTFGLIDKSGNPVAGSSTNYNFGNDNQFWDAALLAGGVVGGAVAGLFDTGGAAVAGSTAGDTTTSDLLATQAGGAGATGGAGAAGAAGGAGGAGANTTAELLATQTGATAGTTAAASTMGLGQWAQLASSIYGLYQGNQLKSMGANADPNAPYRAQYAQMLNNLVSNPSSVTSTPGYQAGLDQATQTLTRQGASQGLTGSGTMAAALAQEGAQYEGQMYQQQLSNLMSLAGMGSTGAGGNMNAFAAGSSIQNNSVNNFLKILPSLGGYFGAGSGGG